MKVDKQTFYEKTTPFEDIPLYQAEGSFPELEAKESKYSFHIDNAESPTIGCWGRMYKFGCLKMFQVKSICYNHPDNKAIGAFLQELRESYPIVNIKDENLYQPELEKTFRLNGYRRPIGQFGTNLTIMVNVSEPPAYSRMWKRNIRLAKETPDISFEELKQPTDEQLNEILDLFKENSKQKKLSYCYTKSELDQWLSDKKFRLFVVKLENDIIAGRIIMVNGKKAADVTTANGDKARSVRGCTQYLVDCIFETLRNEGVQSFDFSCIPIGRKGAEGVCEFKEGVTSGKLMQYNGDWLATRKNWQRWMVWFINKYIRKAYEY